MRSRPDIRLLAAIVAGGMVGAATRAALEEAWPTHAGAWPWATFAVNVAGSFALGYFVTRLQERLPPSTYPRPFLGTGLCGALTTFSTVQVELVRLAKDGHPGTAVGYAAASLFAGLLAVVTASHLVRRVRVFA